MIRRGTWIALLLLLVLVGLSFFLQARRARTATTAAPTQGLSPLFDDLLGEPLLLRIEGRAGQAVEFARNEEGTWVLKAPEQAQADQAAAQAAASQVGALRVLSTVELSPEIVGLDAPAYEFTLKFGDRSTHTLLLGSVTPIADGYYAQLDGGPYQVVEKYGLDQLIELIGAPPYAATPTPKETPSATLSITPLSASSTLTGVVATGAANSQESLSATATP